MMFININSSSSSSSSIIIVIISKFVITMRR